MMEWSPLTIVLAVGVAGYFVERLGSSWKSVRTREADDMTRREKHREEQTELNRRTNALNIRESHQNERDQRLNEREADLNAYADTLMQQRKQ